MKKITALLAAAVTAALCIIPAFAGEAPFRTAYDLYVWWEKNNACPDYVTGVWSTDGSAENLTIAVQDTEEGRRGKEEILAAVAKDGTVTFASQEYSRNYLRRVQEEILPLFEADCGLVSAGVHDMDNRLHLGILTARKGDPKTEAMLADLRAQYGDIFVIEYTDGIFTTDLVRPLPSVSPGTDASARSPLPWILTAAGLLLLTAGLQIALRRRRGRLLQSADGPAVSASLTRHGTEAAVKEAVISVPPELDGRILTAAKASE